jgi:hypothetical protein
VTLSLYSAFCSSSSQDPSAPKRPPSAFLFYCQTQRPKLKKEHPDLKNTELSVLLGQQWKAAPPEVRQPHIAREEHDREIYKARIFEWRRHRKAEETFQKQHRQAVAEQFVRTGGKFCFPHLPWTIPPGMIMPMMKNAPAPATPAIPMMKNAPAPATSAMPMMNALASATPAIKEARQQQWNEMSSNQMSLLSPLLASYPQSYPTTQANQGNQQEAPLTPPGRKVSTELLEPAYYSPQQSFEHPLYGKPVYYH